MSDNSMTWDGTDLGLYRFQVVDHSVPFMADITFAEHIAAFGDAEFTSTNYEKRNITLRCSVTGDTSTELDANMSEVLRVMNPILGDKVFTIDGLKNRFVGRATSFSEPSIKGRWGYEFAIGVVALAHTQDETETNASGAIGADPSTITVPTVSGNVSRTFAELYVRNTTGGTLTDTSITLDNSTTNESITWKGTLLDDQWIRFGTLDDNGRFSASIDTSDGTGADPEAETYSSAITGYVSGDWVRLKGGIENSITVTGVATGTLEWVYRGRYL